MTEDRVAGSPEDRWGWEAHEHAQRKRFAASSLADKIAWLEEAQRMVLTLATQRLNQTSGVLGDREDG